MVKKPEERQAACTTSILSEDIPEPNDLGAYPSQAGYREHLPNTVTEENH